MIKINQFDKGLYLGLPKDKLPPGSCFRYRGVSPLSDGSIRSRNGSAQLSALDAHSIFYFNSNYYYGVLTSLYKGLSAIKTGLSGNSISFAKMPPTAGIVDYLFCCEGTTPFKVDSSGNVTDWGFAVPASNPTYTYTLWPDFTGLVFATYKWTVSAAGTNEYYCELLAGGDPSLPEPTYVYSPDGLLTLGIIGALSASSYAYGDNDGLGYNTIYVRLASGVDPDVGGTISYSIDTNYLSGGHDYAITYKNSVTGHRSNAGSVHYHSSVSSSVGDALYRVGLSNIPDPTAVDSQIDTVEIWRTESDGTVLFYLDSIAVGVTTYNDDATETLSSTELPIDNDQPYDYFTDCYGPHNASMFWITATEAGSRGLLFYSPIGRSEAMEGYIQVTSDDDGLQAIFGFSSQLGVISKSGIFIINGTNPYYARKVEGCPGTLSGKTVAVTPFGIFYEAYDGIRVFDGTGSVIVLPGSMERIIQGESLGDFTSFSGTLAAYCRNEYIITDGLQSLAYDISRQRFRDLGIGFSALYWNDQTKQIIANLSSVVVEYEKYGENDDNGSTFEISIEPPYFNTENYQEAILQHLTFDINTSSVEYTITLTHDDTETVIGVIQTTSRELVSFSIGISALRFGIRITGNCSATFELHEILAEIYVSENL